MRNWRNGTFERHRLPGLYRAFAPAHAVESLEDIDLKALWDQGKRLLLLDVDNTIVAWKQENFKPSVLDWIKQAQRMGFGICIISNTRRVARLGRIRDMLGVETVRGRFKPSRAMYRLALIKFNVRREQAVMIGDQMMTDILGANRAGVDAIWVKQMETKEFAPTKVNRFIEGLLTSAVYKALVVPEGATGPGLSVAEAKEITLVQQVVRFVIVGGSSFVIDAGLTHLMMKTIHVGGDEFGVVLGQWLQSNARFLFGGFSTPDSAAAPILGGVASIFAIFNSFIWNRAWTFEAQGKDRRSTQLSRFYAVSILGAFINAGLFSSFYSLVPGKRDIIAKAMSALVVAVWNFLGMRYYAFRPRRS